MLKLKIKCYYKVKVTNSDNDNLNKHDIFLDFLYLNNSLSFYRLSTSLFITLFLSLSLPPSHFLTHFFYFSISYFMFTWRGDSKYNISDAYLSHFFTNTFARYLRLTYCDFEDFNDVRNNSYECLFMIWHAFP